MAEVKKARETEKFRFFKHDTGSIVQHVETGEQGPCIVREIAPEVLGVFVNFGNGTFEEVPTGLLEVVEPVYYSRGCK